MGGVGDRDGQERILVIALGVEGCAYGYRPALQGLCLFVAGEVPAVNQWCPSLTWYFSPVDFRKDLKEIGIEFRLPNGTPEFTSPHGSRTSEFPLPSTNWSFTGGGFGE